MIPPYTIGEEKGRLFLRFEQVLVVEDSKAHQLREHIQGSLTPHWAPVCLNADSEKELRGYIDRNLEWCLREDDLLDPVYLDASGWEGYERVQRIDAAPFVYDVNQGSMYGPYQLKDDDPMGWYRERWGRSTYEILREDLDAAIKRNGDTCIDGLRMAQIGDLESERHFADRRTCCGSCEFEVSVFSKKYRLGFNYGH